MFPQNGAEDTRDNGDNMDIMGVLDSVVAMDTMDNLKAVDTVDALVTMFYNPCDIRDTVTLWIPWPMWTPGATCPIQ